MTIFPPQVLDVGEDVLLPEQPVSREYPGRRYIGISTTGVRLTTAEIRIAEVLMAAGQLLLDRSGDAADPYLTLVGYFSATRELAGMARYMGDDVQTALAKGRPWSLLPRRNGTDYGQLHVAELTSRVQRGHHRDAGPDGGPVRHRVRLDGGEAGAGGAARGGQPVPERGAPVRRGPGHLDAPGGRRRDPARPDARRRPAEEHRRVHPGVLPGRPRARQPGLVVALGNWARPRDLAHFEQFRHYHERFYAEVEALSVTPFSVTSLERGLDGVLVSAARVCRRSSRRAVAGAQRRPDRGAAGFRRRG